MASTAEDLRHHISLYWKIFITLVFLTMVTVGVSYLQVSTSMAVAIAMFVAIVKGTFVACVFMHLISEKTWLYSVLILTVFFFILVMVLPVMTEGSTVKF